jgi:signal-transduction protein with cAMP-binding, CBS, and nucleotidyltransferase domain
MIEQIVTIEPSATVKQAAELMNMHEIGCLVVVNCKKPIGILTERDMINRIICESRESEATKVIDIMSKPLITASPNMRAGDAAKLMFERNIKKLPVVENGRLVGLVTITDLLRSSGVIEFLNKLSLNGTSKHMKKLVNLYFDPLKLHRRRCPLIMKDGFSMGCQVSKCMWWVGDECAVSKLSRQISTEDLSEA